ncbi:MAG: hypothetical protein ACLP8S_18675 [Solirubrobacteraceae bacterium]
MSSILGAGASVLSVAGERVVIESFEAAVLGAELGDVVVDVAAGGLW